MYHINNKNNTLHHTTALEQLKAVKKKIKDSTTYMVKLIKKIVSSTIYAN